MALVLDTGPLLAALDAADPDHESCAALVTGAAEDLVVPALALAELDFWCQHADPRLGVVDASIVALVERLGETKPATLDHRHFAVVRPAHTRALQLLP